MDTDLSFRNGASSQVTREKDNSRTTVYAHSSRIAQLFNLFAERPLIGQDRSWYRTDKSVS